MAQHQGIGENFAGKNGMQMKLDHLAVAATTLSAAVTHVETSLGVNMTAGGRHARFGTHNQLLGLCEGLYLEAISVDPGAPHPKDARWFDLDRFQGRPRLNNWICRADDLDAAIDALPEAGRAVDLARGDLRWRMAVPEDGILPFDGLFPALIQWQVEVLPGETLPGSGARLNRLELCHPEAAALAAVLTQFLKIARVKFEPGDIEMRAMFETIGGERMLV